MRISDWSSDVCSSDLQHHHGGSKGNRRRNQSERSGGNGGGEERHRDEKATRLEYQLPICERQKAEASHRLVEILLVTLEQQDIAGLEADIAPPAVDRAALPGRSEENTSELQSLMRLS